MSTTRWLLEQEVDVLEGKLYGKSGRITAVDENDYTIFFRDKTTHKIRCGFVKPSLSHLLMPNDRGFRLLFRPGERIQVIHGYLKDKVGILLSGDGSKTNISCRFSNNFLPVTVATKDCCLIRFIPGDVVSCGRGPQANCVGRVCDSKANEYNNSITVRVELRDGPTSTMTVPVPISNLTLESPGPLPLLGSGPRDDVHMSPICDDDRAWLPKTTFQMLPYEVNRVLAGIQMSMMFPAHEEQVGPEDRLSVLCYLTSQAIGQDQQSEAIFMQDLRHELWLRRNRG